MKVAAMSDMHGQLPTDIKPVDLVLICGDVIPLRIQHYADASLAWFNSTFLDWCKNLKCDKIIMIAGNHDFYLEKYGISLTSLESQLGDKFTYLYNSGTEYKGLKFYGCPNVTGPRGWAFYEGYQEAYNNIPDCDVLLTHQPPRIDHLGCSYPDTAWEENWGSIELAKVIESKNIKYNFSGHIHSGNHNAVHSKGTTFYNVSLLDEDYIRSYGIKYLNIDAGETEG